MTKINLLRPTVHKFNYSIWFKYENPESVIDRIHNDLKLITPKLRGAAAYTKECCCLPTAHTATYVELHGEIYQI
jgi:hypothetical protein